MICNLTTEQLDKQSSIYLDGWLDLDSQEYKNKDDNPAFTRKCLRIGMEDGFMFTDSLGRVWGKGNNGTYYPFHFDYGRKKYGFRIAKQASN